MVGDYNVSRCALSFSDKNPPKPDFTQIQFLKYNPDKNIMFYICYFARDYLYSKFMRLFPKQLDVI